ncbi:MAG TPA: MATE family efflux transporter [Xanthomonadales bacterium]|nr:MATE family efflux transporter [Xanthomonadales bacterium]
MSSITKTHNHAAEVRRTLQLAAPVILGQLAIFSMNFVDTVMSGRLPQKDIALAALGIGGALWSGLMMFTIGLLMAVQPSVAQLDGAGFKPQAAALTRQAFWIALFIAVPYWAVCFFSEPLLTLFRIDPVIVPVAAGYLRAISWGAPGLCLIFLLRFFSEGAGHTRPTMFYGLAGALLNVPMNYVFMFGHLGIPALGTRGCGYATSIVIWLQLLMLLAYMRKHRHYRPFELFQKIELPRRREISLLLRLGLPIAMTVSLEGGLFVAAAMLIGQLGPLASAAHLIAINFSALLFMIPLGMASAVTVRVGNAMGRKDPAAARYAGIVGLLIVACLQCFNMTLMFGFPALIVGIYTDEAAVGAVAVSLLFYAAIFQLPDGIQICAAGALRGLKDAKVPMLYNLIAYWVVGMSVGYYLTFAAELGPAGMWIGMIAGLSMGALLLAGRFMHLTTRLIRASGLSLPDSDVKAAAN